MAESKLIKYIEAWPDKPSVEELYLKENQSQLRQSQNNPYNSPYRYLLRALSILGMTYKPGNESFFFRSYWDTFVLVLISSTTFFTVSTLGSISMSPQVLYIFYAYLLLGLAVRLVLLWKRQDLYALLVNIMKLNQDLKVEMIKCQQCSRRSMVLFFAWVSTVTIILMLYSFRVVTMNKGYSFFGIQLHVSEKSLFMYIIPTSLAFSTITSSCTMSISVITSSNLYFSAKTMLAAFGDRLSLISKGYVTKDAITFHLSLYRKITLRFADIDSCVSFCSLLLYATAICCFFNTLSTCISSPGLIMGDTIFLGQIGVSFLLGVIIFIMLTYTGSSANSEYSNLKSALLELMESSTDNRFNLETTAMLNMLTDSIMMQSPNFTGGGMFTINGGLILTTLGAMITYGVIIF